MNKKSNDNNSCCDEKQVENFIKEGIKKLENMDCKDKKGIKKHGHSSVAGGIYCLGFIGAVVYFIQQATSLGTGIVGFFKALI